MKLLKYIKNYIKYRKVRNKFKTMRLGIDEVEFLFAQSIISIDYTNAEATLEVLNSLDVFSEKPEECKFHLVVKLDTILQEIEEDETLAKDIPMTLEREAFLRDFGTK